MKIRNIIIKKLREKLSDNHSGLFDEWINMSDKNQKFYNTLESMKGQGKDIEKLVNLDLDKAWNDVLVKAKKKEVPKKTLRITTWFKYAASIAILISIGYYFTLDSNVKQIVKESVVTNSNLILLETSDGNVSVISEDENRKIIDTKGKEVGRQEGSKIVYENDIVDELVYNKLSVPNGKRFELLLSDGTMITLNSGTSIRYPVNFIAGKERLVFLEGEAFFDVAKDSLHPFIVNSDDLNIRVLGTQFCVNSYKNNSTSYAVLVEGSVDAYESGAEYNKLNAFSLEPNDMISQSRYDGSIQIEQVDTSFYTAWMYDTHVFEKARFQDILNNLERQFNVQVENNKPALNKYLFTATFTDETLDQVMKTIQSYKYFDYKIEGNKLIIN